MSAEDRFAARTEAAMQEYEQGSARDRNATLVAALRAALDAQEAAAKAADIGPWTITRHTPTDAPTPADYFVSNTSGTIGIFPEEYNGQANARHAIAHNPAFVLADIAAKRAVVDLHDRDHECSTIDERGEVDHCTWVMRGDVCTTVRLLAEAYGIRP